MRRKRRRLSVSLMGESVSAARLAHATATPRNGRGYRFFGRRA